jgi:aerobic carbon-monoxide dehydrogenase large subunit
VDDVQLPRLLHAAFVRSEQAHATLLAIDAAEALAVPGVHAVITAQDLGGEVAPIRALVGTPGYQECDMPALATGKVRFVGEPVALVVAESRYPAEDGAAAALVRYEPLPLVLEIDEALADDAPLLHDEVDGNLYNSFETSTPGIGEAFEAADEVVELELTQQRYGTAALEGRAAIADWKGSGHLTVWLSSQVPHIARMGLAKFLGLAESSVRVISPDVGDGFGPKCVVYQEEVAVAAASRRLGRPVKWVSDRSEDLLSTIHGREQIHRVRAAATAEGRVTAVSVEIFASNGAYALLEHLVYDSRGQLVTTSFMDYLLPTALEVPAMDALHLESPSPNTPGGWKGMGEGGSINAPPAIVSAVNDAVGRLGVPAANHTPLTPEWVTGQMRENPRRLRHPPDDNGARRADTRLAREIDQER